MKHLVAGTAGHIDHGKSALVRALTGIEMDRLPEEKRRGISIELGYAFLDLPDGTRIGMVDVPGHERFVRTMVAGATGIDFALLVVAADDSVMPQTREHLAILDLLGLRHGLVAVNKIDLVDEELVELVVEETRDAVEGTFLAGAPIIPVSAVTGAGLGELRAAIEQVASRVPERAVGALARLPIDRSFSIAGYGTVVTGTLASGSLRVGDEVEILPRGLSARVRGLQWHGTAVEAISAGQRTAVNLAGIKHDELARGDTLCAAGAFQATSMVDGRVALERHTPRPLRHGSSVSFHLGTSEVRGRVVLLDPAAEAAEARLRPQTGERPAPNAPADGRRVAELKPGGTAWAQLRLAEPVVARRGDRFILRTAGGEATLGGGQVLDAHPLKHRRQRAEAAKALERIADGGLQAAVVHDLHKADGPLRLTTLALQLAETVEDVAAACGDTVRIVRTGADAWAYDGALLDEFAERALAAIAAHHKEKPLLATGLSPAALSSRADPARRVTDEVISAMMAELVAKGRVRRVDGTYSAPTHRVELNERQAAIRQAILEACRAKLFSPPTLADLQKALPYPPQQTASVHEALLKSGELVDGGVCGFHPDAVEAAWEKLEAYLRQHGQITISEFRQLLDTSRRYAMGLMHHYDEARRVARDGDYRRLPGAGLEALP